MKPARVYRLSVAVLLGLVLQASSLWAQFYTPRFLGAEYLNNVTTHPIPIEGVDWGGSGFGGGAGTSFEFFGSTLDPSAEPDSFSTVRLTFSHLVTQKAYRFLRFEVQGTGAPPPQGRGWVYRGFHNVRLTARDTVSGQQLELAFVERCITDTNGTILPSGFQSASFDSTWFPDTTTLGAREYLTVIKRPYTGSPKPSLAHDGAFIDSLPALYSLWVRRKTSADAIDTNDQFLFRWGVPTGTITGNLQMLCDDPAGPLRDVRTILRLADGGMVLNTTYTDVNGHFDLGSFPIEMYPFVYTVSYEPPGTVQGIPPDSVVMNGDKTLNHSVLCRFTPPIDLTATGTNGRDPELVIASPKSMLAVWERDNLVIAHSLSSDSSKTFSSPNPVTTPGRQPSAVRTPLATLLVAAAAVESMVVSRSDDGGISMAPLPTVVVRRGGTRAPALAVDGFGRVQMAFDSNSDSVLFSRSTNDGLSFGPVLTISSPLGLGRRARNPDVANNGSDTVYVAWSDSFSSGPPRERIRLNRSSNGGVSFFGATTISDTTRRALDAVISASPGIVHAVWIYRGTPDSLHYARSVNSGGTFSRVAAAAIPADVNTARGVSFAIDASGTLHAVVQAKVSGVEECFYYSLPSGTVNFSSATDISNTPGPSISPVLVLDPSGRPMIAWSEVIGGGREIVYTRRVR